MTVLSNLEKLFNIISYDSLFQCQCKNSTLMFLNEFSLMRHGFSCIITMLIILFSYRLGSPGSFRVLLNVDVSLS